MGKKHEKIPGVLAGVSGEYLVAAELSRRGYIACITLRNTKLIDILASNANAKRSVCIQVKTNQSARKAWLLKKNLEEYYTDNLFYVFVNLTGKSTQPDFYIVPSVTVAKQIKEEHTTWLLTPGKKGQKRKDTTIRMFRDEKDEYLGKWELLGL